MSRAEPGLILEGLRFERLLGRGGMGEVWAAEHLPTGQTVAVKLLGDDLARDERARGALMAEVRSTARLDHPHVVVVLDHGVAPAEHELAGAPWLAMELGDHDLQREPPRDWGGIREVLVHVARGLAHIHGRGLVHRDLKPENVLRVGSSWKIADLGIAHVLRGADPEGTAKTAGSPAYMAPEQLKGDLEAQGPHTDLYALGCLAWELLHGAPPFVRESITQVARAHLYEPLPAYRATSAPDGTRALVHALLAKDPADRPMMAADALAALLALPDANEGTVGADVDRQASQTWFTLADPTLSLESVISSDEEGAELQVVVPRLAAAVPPDDWRRVQLVTRILPRHSAELALAAMRRPPLIGRQAERDTLWSALSTVRQTGRAGLVTITGLAGSGRTALLDWLGESAVESGAAIVIRRGPTHREPLPSPSKPFDRPLLVLVDGVLDDEEAARFATHQLAFRSFRAWPALFVVTGRADDTVLGELRVAAGEGLTEIALGPLPDSDVDTLVGHLIRLDESARLHVLRRAGGSPGVAVALVLALAQQGGLVAGADGYALDGAVDIGALTDLDSALDSALDAVFERCTEDDITTFALVAALDGPVHGPWLAEHLEAFGLRPRAQLVSDLLMLGVAQGLAERWRVAGGVRSRLAIRLGATRWRELCAQLAARLDGDPQFQAMAGLLWFEAGNDERGVGAVNAMAHEDGLGGLRVRSRFLDEVGRALERLDVGEDDPVRGAWLHRMCGLANQRGQLAENERYGHELLDVARRNGWIHHEAAALRDLASIATLRGELALDWCRQAWDLACRGGSLGNRGNVLLGYLGQLSLCREFDLADQLIEEWLSAVEYGSRMHTPFLRQRGILNIRRGNIEDAWTDVQRTLELDEAAGREHASAFSNSILGQLHMDAGDTDAGRRHFERALERFRVAGNLYGVRNCLSNLGEAALASDDLDGAQELARQALALSLAITSEPHEPAQVLVQVALLQGREPESEHVQMVDAGARADRGDVGIRSLVLLAWLALPDEDEWGARLADLRRVLPEQTYIPRASLRCAERLQEAMLAQDRPDLAEEMDPILVLMADVVAPASG